MSERPLVSLIMQKKYARKKILSQIQKGNIIDEMVVADDEDLVEYIKEIRNWNSYNEELLLRMFTNDSIKKEYTANLFHSGSYDDFNDKVDHYTDILREEIGRLESILGKLELIPADSSTSTTEDVPMEKELSNSSSDIFIVHGHDEALKETVARLIMKLGFNPIILHEKASSGKTIIEKIEKHSNVTYAVVLLTPDDVGNVASKSQSLSPRARQNVVFEFGYFIGLLNRDKTCALKKGGIEIPSDWHGIVYIDVDKDRNWNISLAKEFESAGLNVDFNKLLK